MTKWHKGPPPSVGWWPASCIRIPGKVRWWNGEWWSAPCYPTDTAEDAAEFAMMRSKLSDRVEWTKRPKSWPDRSRT
jgi:hypothetical protein